MINQCEVFLIGFNKTLSLYMNFAEVLTGAADSSVCQVHFTASPVCQPFHSPHVGRAKAACFVRQLKAERAR